VMGNELDSLMSKNKTLDIEYADTPYT